MWPLFKRFLIGKPLKTLDEGARHLSRTKALALLSSDALSSVAYGTEQIITVLFAVGGLATLWLQVPVVALVLVLLGAITLSYRQIFHAYPAGGGADLVTSRSCGMHGWLFAAGSILRD